MARHAQRESKSGTRRHRWYDLSAEAEERGFEEQKKKKSRDNHFERALAQSGGAGMYISINKPIMQKNAAERSAVWSNEYINECFLKAFH